MSVIIKFDKICLKLSCFHTREPIEMCSFFHGPLLQILPEEQHGNGDAVFRRGCSGSPQGESDLSAAAQHHGGGGSALHERL